MGEGCGEAACPEARVQPSSVRHRLAHMPAAQVLHQPVGFAFCEGIVRPA